MSEKCVYLLVLSGINLRNFHHCTKQRRMQSFGQKDVEKGFGNWFRLVIEDKTARNVTFFMHRTVMNPNVINLPKNPGLRVHLPTDAFFRGVSHPPHPHVATALIAIE